MIILNSAPIIVVGMFRGSKKNKLNSIYLEMFNIIEFFMSILFKWNASELRKIICSFFTYILFFFLFVLLLLFRWNKNWNWLEYSTKYRSWLKSGYQTNSFTKQEIDFRSRKKSSQVKSIYIWCAVSTIQNCHLVSCLKCSVA